MVAAPISTTLGSARNQLRLSAVKNITRPECRGVRPFVERLNDVITECCKIVVPHHADSSNALQLGNHFIW